MPATNSADVKPQPHRDIYGCGTQFTQKATKYPQSKDLNRHLSSGYQQQTQSKELSAVAYFDHMHLHDWHCKEDRQYVHGCHEFRKHNSSSSSGGSFQSAQSDPISRWEQAPQGEMPWDHLGVVHARKGESSKRKTVQGKK